MKRFLALFAMAAVLLVAGCKPDPFLTVSPSDLSFGQDGGSQTVKVSANYPWTASASGAGVTVSPASGEGDGTVTITVAAANSTSDMRGSVSFSSEGLSASVSISQDAKSAIIVGNVSQIPAEGGTFRVDIQYNTEYTVEIEKSAQSWITFNGTKAMQSGKLEFTFATNEGDERTGKVTVTDKSGKVQQITLTFVQEEMKVIKVGDITPIPAEGGTFKVDIEYNTDYTVEIEPSAQSWIMYNGTKAMQNGKLEFTFAANEGDERTGKVTVTDKSGKVSQITLTFVQAAENKVLVVGDAATVPAEGGSVEVDVKYNVDYAVEVEPSAASWIHYVKTKAVKEGKLVFTVDANETPDARQGKVTIKDNAGSVEDVTITVTQEAKSVITVGEPEQISYEGGVYQVDINYNTDYEVEVEQSAQSWIMYNGTKAMQSGKLEFTFAANEGEERTGKVMVKDKSGKAAPITLTFVQESAAWIALERAALVAFYEANNGDQWVDNKNWCSDKPLNTWAGVRMTPDGKHVRELVTPGANGYIPKEIANLTELERLAIASNPSNPAKNPRPLPEEIGQLKKLKELAFQNYSIGGTLPASLFDLTGLEVLSISLAKDMDKAHIPSAIGNLINLRSLTLVSINLTGPLPPEMGNLTKLKELFLGDNQLTGSIPDSFGNLLNLEELDLSYNNLGGEIPSTFYRMKYYWRLWPEMILGNKFTQENVRNAKIPAPLSPPIKSLSGKTLNLEEIFANNQYTVLFKLHSGFDILPGLVALYREKKDEGLEIITYDDSGVGGGEAAQLKYLDDYEHILSEYGVEWESFVRFRWNVEDPELTPFYAKKGHSLYSSAMDDIVIIGPDGTVDYTTLVDRSKNALQNALAYLYEKMDAPLTYYSSNSYSEDGKVYKLQDASLGKGIDMVITGDGYSDRLIADGTFRNAANQAVEDFFSVEPYKSMRNRFNVYLVNAVSKNEDYFNGGSTALSVQFVGPTSITGNINKALEYAAKAVNKSRMDDVLVLVLVNSSRSGGTAHLLNAENDNSYAGGASVAFVPYKGVSVEYGLSHRVGGIIHEAGGHGFGKLADEYVISDYGTISESAIANVIRGQEKGFYMNVSVTDDPQKVPWYKFIGDSRYEDEEIGIYEGGFLYAANIWRPTEQSVMRSNDLYHNFNAPSRAQIYTRIMKLSEGQDWEFDYETFVKWDKTHPDTKTKAAPMGEPAGEEIEPVPPVMVGKTWRQALKR